MRSENRAAVTELRVFRGVSVKSKRISVKERDFYSLSYRYCGKAWFKSKENELVSEANSITFMPKNISYETEILEDTQIAVIHFKLDRDIEFRNPATIDVSDKEIRLLFEKLLQNTRTASESTVDFSAMSAFYELLSKLESLEKIKSSETTPRKIRLAKEYMNDGFSDALFSIESLAESLGVSASYLRREFSRAYGKSPIAYLRELRVACAKELLQSGYLSISEIAAQSGFSSTSYFIQVFHKTVGYSPAKYREEMRIVY